MKKLTRLWFPLLVFLAFLSALFSSDVLLQGFGANVSAVARNTFIYGIQIGVWLSAALLLNRLIEVFFWDGFVGALSGRKVPRLPKDITALSLFILAGTGVMATVLDRSVTGILATSGIASLIIGLALKNVILDMFIGLAIHIERPFRIGDWIMVHRNRKENHIVARVIEINWRTTRLCTTSNNMIVVPNSLLGVSITTNFMQPKPHFRIDLPFVIDYEVPPERASRILQAGVMSVAGENGVLEKPEPEVRLKEATLHGQQYEVRFFILPVHISPNESKDLVNHSVLEHLKCSGISPAQPKEEIYMSRKGKRNLDSEQDKDLYELLTRTELFGNLNIEELMQVFSGMKRRELRKGDILYRQGDKGETMFLLLEGLLNSSIQIQGAEKPAKVESIKAGSHFGEESVMLGTGRPSTIHATTDAIIYEIAKEQMKEILIRRGDLLAMLNEDIAMSTSKISTRKKAASKNPSHKKLKTPKSSMQKAVQTLFSFF